MTSPLIKDIELFLNDKPSIFALREKAKNALISSGLPTKKTEAWKYTDVSPIIRSNFDISTENQKCDHHCCHNDNEYFIEIHFCKGKLHIEDINTPKGLTILPMPLALYENEYKKFIFNSFNLGEHPFAALNGMYLEQGICIIVEKDTILDKPILIKYNQTNCSDLQFNIHNLIIAEKNTSLEIVEDFTSDNNSTYLTNIVNEIYLKNNANLIHYKKQKESSSSYHIALNTVRQQEKSVYKQFYLSDGAKISRQETLVNLKQPEASSEIYAVYWAKKDCITDITTNINHLKEHTSSNQYIKSVLEEESCATFQGKIHIAPNATKTSGHQLHKALYLNDNAILNCKPELEIYADDVKCSHGASCGEIDKEQLFYLTSRGIDTKTALNLLTTAHLEEILALIPNQKIKDLFFFSK